MLKMRKTLCLVLMLVSLAFVTLALSGSKKLGSQTAAVASEPDGTPDAATSESDAALAVPVEAELPETENYNRSSIANTILSVATTSARRKDDKAWLEVTAVIAATEDDAKKWVQQRIITSLAPGLMPKGSFSGRVIGEECYNSNAGDGPPRGGAGLIARDGRAVVKISLVPPIVKNKEGVFVTDTPLTPKDVALVEAQAAKALDKLTKMGHTSKSEK